jgi:hypothetical protein
MSLEGQSMAGTQQRAQVVVWHAETKSFITAFFFVEATVTGGVCLDMSEQFQYPPGSGFAADHHLPQDGVLPHWSLHVRETRTRTFPDCWIGRDGPVSWSPRSGGYNPVGFFFLGARHGPSVCCSCA